MRSGINPLSSFKPKKNIQEWDSTVNLNSFNSFDHKKQISNTNTKSVPKNREKGASSGLGKKGNGSVFSIKNQIDQSEVYRRSSRSREDEDESQLKKFKHKSSLPNIRNNKWIKTENNNTQRSSVLANNPLSIHQNLMQKKQSMLVNDDSSNSILGYEKQVNLYLAKLRVEQQNHKVNNIQVTSQ